MDVRRAMYLTEDAFADGESFSAVQGCKIVEYSEGVERTVYVFTGDEPEIVDPALHALLDAEMNALEGHAHFPNEREGGDAESVRTHERLATIHRALVEAQPLIGPSLRETIKDALEGDSNDAEHEALFEVAEALGITYDPSEN